MAITRIVVSVKKNRNSKTFRPADWISMLSYSYFDLAWHTKAGLPLMEYILLWRWTANEIECNRVELFETEKPSRTHIV